VSPVAVVVPTVALLPLAVALLTPVAVVVPHVAVLPLAVVVPRRRVARRPRFAASLYRLSSSSCRLSLSFIEAKSGTRLRGNCPGAVTIETSNLSRVGEVSPPPSL
jgi:hypothetical protein